MRLLPLLVLSLVNAWAQNPKPIFDGRLTLRPGQLSPAEQKTFVDTIVPAASREWRKRDKDSVCEPGFHPEAIDVASGAFTAAGASQKAILYRYCTFGHDLALDGITILDNDRPIAHIIFEGGENRAIGALPDIDANGIAELVIAGGATNQGITVGWISIIEIGAAGVAKLGHAEIYSEDGSRESASRILVIAGNPPKWYRETFQNDAAWKKSEGPVQITLDRDEIQYELLK